MAHVEPDVQLCHCIQCRKQTGHFLAAAHVADNDLTIVGEEHLQWFEATELARRGFCRECGSMLFWKANDSDHHAVAAGCIDGATGLRSVAHIFTEFKGDYYELSDGLPQHPGTGQ